MAKSRKAKKLCFTQKAFEKLFSKYLPEESIILKARLDHNSGLFEIIYYDESLKEIIEGGNVLHSNYVFFDEDIK